MIPFHTTVNYIKQNWKITFSVILVLTIYVLFPDLFPISYISAISQKHVGHGSIVTTIGGVAKIHKEHKNNSSTNTKPIHNSGDPNSLVSGVQGNNNTKVVILTFGDTEKSQFTTAKPILDQYEYKASFFITCGYVGDEKQTQRMSWNDILALQQDGQDIESKGMTHADLNNLSPNAMDYEIGGSKQCT
jgi:peptidoglycan/xylan/chitin deacetylase (PgdA/CDA1 family)